MIRTAVYYSGSGVISGLELTSDNDTEFTVHPGVAKHDNTLAALLGVGKGMKLLVEMPDGSEILNGNFNGGAFPIPFEKVLGARGWEGVPFSRQCRAIQCDNESLGLCQGSEK